MAAGVGGGMSVPGCSAVAPRPLAGRGRAAFSAGGARKARPHRFIHEVPQQSAGYTQKQVEWSLFREVAGLKFATTGRERLRAAAPVRLSSGQWLRVDFGAVRTGFPGLRVQAVRATRLLLVFDELLLQGQIVFDRSSCLNTIGLELATGAELNFESFEP